MDEERHMKCELKLLSSLEKIFFEKERCDDQHGGVGVRPRFLAQKVAVKSLFAVWNEEHHIAAGFL